MDEKRLRRLYHTKMNDLLYFANDDSYVRRKIYENIFLETWGHIPYPYRKKILGNLEFILCKCVIDKPRPNTPACTLFSRISQLCFVIFNPFAEIFKPDTRVHILAHELTHVYYRHPNKGFKIVDESGMEEEKVYIDNVAEPQAYALGEKWRILPHPDDIHMLRGYKKYVLKEDIT
jgi:hypothetical protein